MHCTCQTETLNIPDAPVEKLLLLPNRRFSDHLREGNGVVVLCHDKYCLPCIPKM